MKINGLDHIALMVSDPEFSAEWYVKTLGLKRYHFENEWEPYPILVLGGTSGLALFPSQSGQPYTKNQMTGLSHFAFKIDIADLDGAKHRLEKMGIKVSFEDHKYFHSIYFSDPDAYIVELTALTVKPEIFYR